MKLINILKEIKIQSIPNPDEFYQLWLKMGGDKRFHLYKKHINGDHDWLLSNITTLPLYFKHLYKKNFKKYTEIYKDVLEQLNNN